MRDATGGAYVRRPGAGAHRDERGASMSVFVIVVFAALILVAGLVIDGGQKVTATRRAESVAAGAARAGADAGATGSIAGRPGGAGAVTVARAYLRSSPGVTGDVVVHGGQVIVTTQVRLPTVFLSVLGLTSVTGYGESVHELRSSP